MALTCACRRQTRGRIARVDAQTGTALDRCSSGSPPAGSDPDRSGAAHGCNKPDGDPCRKPGRKPCRAPANQSGKVSGKRGGHPGQTTASRPTRGPHVTPEGEPREHPPQKRPRARRTVRPTGSVTTPSRRATPVGPSDRRPSSAASCPLARPHDGSASDEACSTSCSPPARSAPCTSVASAGYRSPRSSTSLTEPPARQDRPTLDPPRSRCGSSSAGIAVRSAADDRPRGGRAPADQLRRQSPPWTASPV